MGNQRYKKSSGSWRAVDVPDPRAGETFTRRLSQQTILTVASGRIGEAHVRSWEREFNALGGAPVWVFNALAATSYAPEAITAAVGVFSLATKTGGLLVIIAAIKNPLVRMGASVVSASLRVAVGLSIRVVDSMEAAEREIRASAP